MTTGTLKYDYVPSTACAAATPRAMGTLLVDEKNRVWAPNGTGGHAMISAGGGGGAADFSTLTGVPTDNAPLASALAAKADLVAGKVPVGQLPAAVVGGLNYQGTYNATTNTPAIVAGNKGFYWKVAVAGTALGHTWVPGDMVIDNGTSIDKVDGDEGLSANVAANTANITANANRLAQLGNPVSISGATTLADTHNGENLVCTSTPALTLNTGRIAGFGCSIKGAFTFGGGGLTIGSGITDLRSTTGTAMCCLMQSDTTGAGTTYDLVGTK